ncbi:MAG: hypothetical protein QM710_03005 [Flavobacterium sp.]
MDSSYIISRLKSTANQYAIVDVLRTRLNNVGEFERGRIVDSLKIEVKKESNMDIQKPLFELLFRIPAAS